MSSVVVIIGMVLLISVVIALVIYNMSLHKRLKKFKDIKQRVTNLSVIQDFMSTIGEDSTVDRKIQKINDILIDRYEIKYSTIVVFDGTEYIIKASNVDKKHWGSLKSLQDVQIFKDSITTATPKYITVNKEGEQLPYQQSEFGRAKAAIFFPLYIDNVYIGYWIIESGTPHDFDNVDTTVLEKIKSNIVSVLKTVAHQRTLESMVRKDMFSGLKSEAYLYGEGKKSIDQFTTSTMCMFKIINLQNINKDNSREMGNSVITEVVRYISNNISTDYIFVRYMGPKFVIAFSGVDVKSVAEFLNDLKENVESLKITRSGLIEKPPKLNGENINNYEAQNGKEQAKEEQTEVKKEVNEEQEEYVEPILNFVISSYYKGTGLEEVLKKLEKYLDGAPRDESDINNL